jgi:hypothetical protein
VLSAAGHRKQWTTAAIVAGAILAALTIRILASRSQPLSADEWFTLNALGGDLPALIGERLDAGHSPFYFLLLKALGLGPHSSDFALRLPSTVIDCLGLGLLAWVAAKTSGNFAAFVFAAIACFSPALITHGQIARPYALLYFFLALALAGAVTAIRVPHLTASAFGARSGPAQRKVRIALAAMVAGLVGAGYTQNLGIVIAALAPAAILILPACRANRRFVRIWLLLHAFVWLALLPLLVAAAPTLSKMAENYWIEMADPAAGESLRWILLNTYGFFFDGDRNRFLPAAVGMYLGSAVAGLVLVSLIVHLRRPPVRFIAFAAFAAPAALLALSAVQSLLVPRYFILALWPFFLLAADGAAAVATYIVGRIAVLALLAAIALQGFDATFDQRINDWRFVTAFLDLNSYGVIRGVANTRLEKGMVERHASAGLTVDIALEPDAARARERIDALLGTEPFIWLLESWRPDVPRPDLTGLVACSWQFAQADIVVLARDRGNLPPNLQTCREENRSLIVELRRLLGLQ